MKPIYMIDKNAQGDTEIGRYEIVEVKDMSMIHNVDKSTPTIVLMGSNIPKHFGQEFKEWFMNLDTNEYKVYYISDTGASEGINHPSIAGVVSRNNLATDLDRIYPQYSREEDKSEVNPNTDKIIEYTMTDKEVRESMEVIKKTFHQVHIMNAEDVFLQEGHKPALRVKGELQALNTLPSWNINEYNIFAAILRGEDITSTRISRNYYINLLNKEGGTLDLHADLEDTNLRCHLYTSFPTYDPDGTRTFNGVINIRVIPKKMPLLDNLNLPEIGSIFEQDSGLLLVSGQTRSGKSTTVAGIVNHFNHLTDKHRIILTIEEPVEFVHKKKNAWIIQRRVGEGTDADSYSKATEDAMREDTDIVVIQELRGREEMHNALRLAEVGKLVIATIHANSVEDTVERFVNEFPVSEKEQVRSRLQTNLAGIIHQSLIISDKIGGQLPLVSMLLVANRKIREDLIKCRSREDIKKMINAYSYGDTEQTYIMDRSFGIMYLFQKGLVGKEEVMRISDSEGMGINPEDLDYMLSGG